MSRGGVFFEIDDSEVQELIIDLSGAPLRMQLAAPKVMRTKIGPHLNAEVKVDSAGHMGNWFGIPGTSYVTPLPPHVSWEMLNDWEVESGIEPKGAGKLAHIIAYGSVNNAPAYDPSAALRRTAPFAESALADAAEDAVLGDD